MKKIFKVIFIILPLILATTGVIEFIHYLRGKWCNTESIYERAFSSGFLCVSNKKYFSF